MTGGGISSKRADAGATTVLVVDDNKGVRARAADVLKERGYTVLEAENGFSALALAASWTGRLDVVLADIVMPYCNGVEFVERLKGVRNDFRVLYMSAHLNELISNHERCADEEHFIGKPFRAADLVRKIGDLCKGRTVTAPAHEIPERRRVLIVDDDEKIRDMLCHYLRLNGFEAQGADNGISAIRLLSDSQDAFDIVITDYDMPEMGGLELVRNIRSRFAPRTIIGMSGINTREQDFINVGAHAFFPKPLELQEVLASLRTSSEGPQGEA